MRVLAARFDGQDKKEGAGTLLTMLVSAAVAGGLTCWGWPPSLGGASLGTLLGIGLGASLTVLFLVFSGFSLHHLLGVAGVSRVDGCIEAEDQSLGWRLAFDTGAAFGDVQVALKVSRETFRCRLVRRDIPEESRQRRREAGRSHEMVPEWSSDGELVLLDRKLGTFVFPPSKVLQGSLELSKPLPHPRTTSASHPSRGETTRTQALSEFPDHDPVGRALFASETAGLDAEGDETIAARLQVRWRLDVFLERSGWPDAGISLFLQDDGVGPRDMGHA